MRRVVWQRSGRRGSALGGGLAAGLLLLGLTACTGETSSREPLPDRSVGSQATLDARPVPMDVALGRTVGKRPSRAQARRVEQQVGRVLGRYFDAAYLGGDYPRTDFPGAFDDFAPDLARSARSDRDLLTNAAAGASIEAVVPKLKRVRVDTLAPSKAVVGVTARARLVFLVERADAADRRVTVTGRFLMSRRKAGPWEIFGYDVARGSVVAAREGS